MTTEPASVESAPLPSVSAPPESPPTQSTDPTWICDDPDDDLHSEVVGSPTKAIAPTERPWLEVTRLTITKDTATVSIVWELAGTIPDDVGSAPGWGDWIASWTVDFRASALDYSTLVAVDKEGANDFHIAAESFDIGSSKITPFDAEADGAKVVISGSTITIEVPSSYLERIKSDLIVNAASEMSAPQGENGNGDFFAGWVYTDNSCSTDEPEKHGSWQVL